MLSSHTESRIVAIYILLDRFQFSFKVRFHQLGGHFVKNWPGICRISYIDFLIYTLLGLN